MSTELLAALIAAAVALGTGLITNAGRRDEVDSTKLSTLIDGQAGRIETLESRLTQIEERLTHTEQRLRMSQNHNHALRKALSEALAWVIDAVEWFSGPRDLEPPPVPDFEEWRETLAFDLD